MYTQATFRHAQAENSQSRKSDPDCALLGSLEELLLPRTGDAGLENHLNIQVISKKEKKSPKRPSNEPNKTTTFSSQAN